MKVEVTPAKPDFQPVTISITIESFAELAVLYARFNCPVAIIKQHGFGDDPLTARLETAAADFNEDTDEVFDHISDIAKGYHNKILDILRGLC